MNFFEGSDPTHIKGLTPRTFLTTLQSMIWWFTVISLLRFAFSLASLKAHNAAV